MACGGYRRIRLVDDADDAVLGGDQPSIVKLLASRVVGRGSGGAPRARLTSDDDGSMYVARFLAVVSSTMIVAHAA